MILLDTNVCVGFLHKDSAIIQRLSSALVEDDVAIPGMVEGELYYGVEKSARREENLTLTESFISKMGVIHADDAVMKKFGDLKAALEKTGKRVDDADIIIAATAICNNATLATGNVKHFSRFEGLKLQNWFETKKQEK